MRIIDCFYHLIYYVGGRGVVGGVYADPWFFGLQDLTPLTHHGLEDQGWTSEPNLLSFLHSHRTFVLCRIEQADVSILAYYRQKENTPYKEEIPGQWRGNVEGSPGDRASADPRICGPLSFFQGSCDAQKHPTMPSSLPWHLEAKLQPEYWQRSFHSHTLQEQRPTWP